MSYIKKLLLNKYFQPILSVLAFFEAAVLAIIGWTIMKQPPNSQNEHNMNVFLIVLLIVVILTLIAVIVNGKNDIKKTIITRLCELQNTYLMSPNFITAEEHANISQEKNLSRGGTAKILTNSLTYDMACATNIAKNVIRGARYVYIIPQTNVVISELELYIANLANSLGDPIQSMNLLKNNIEFWVFDKNIACLYNFATLRQTAEGNSKIFSQAWWYINPNDNLPKSYMLTKEIDQAPDLNTLAEIFNDLEKCSLKYNGDEIFENRTSLYDFIGR